MIITADAREVVVLFRKSKPEYVTSEPFHKKPAYGSLVIPRYRNVEDGGAIFKVVGDNLVLSTRLIINRKVGLGAG